MPARIFRCEQHIERLGYRMADLMDHLVHVFGRHKHPVQVRRDQLFYKFIFFTGVIGP